MRVISGEYGGRKLKAVPGTNTRPTTDKIKESIFNIIGPYFDGGTCLDLFAGSGSLSIEAVSRGFNQAILIDKEPIALKTIKENIAMTKEEDKFKVYRNDADRALDVLSRQTQKFDLIFMDPPYLKQEIEKQLLKMADLGLVAENGKIICEVDKKSDLSDEVGPFYAVRRENYGITQIVIYQFKEG
ncbi:16S rRNA (guanine(966)-N(2))-methyltransferase RsmD [Carnobacterium gallinarum]|uniref:16S rRNA (guanine(966)-N(2))-methyltransferase RsmD n=1 Tax=Carnobacterium gallinarum TaxID=2749 RepID=UPI0005523EA3|nr:16S rRNA (guanine(966)-N(2))-methyltransferase RsmD [Carnobacterium gallinarum]